MLDGPHMVPDLLWQARTEKHMPSMTTFQSPTSEQLQKILKEQVHGPTSQIIKETVRACVNHSSSSEENLPQASVSGLFLAVISKLAKK